MFPFPAVPFEQRHVPRLLDMHSRWFTYKKEFFTGALIGDYRYDQIDVYPLCGHERTGIMWQDMIPMSLVSMSDALVHEFWHNVLVESGFNGSVERRSALVELLVIICL